MKSDESGDVFAIAAQLEQELSDVGARRDQDNQDGLRRQDGHDREAVLMLDDGSAQRASSRNATKFVGGADDGRNPSRNVIGLETGGYLAVDQQAIASQYDGGIDSISLPDGCDEVTNARHNGSRFPREVVAKLEITIMEVKPAQSLEDCLAQSYSSP
jgi:hypothetical protein